MIPPTLALLIKSPRPSYVKTRLASTVGPALAVAIYRQMVEKQIRAIPAGWTAHIHFSPAEDESNMKDWLSPLTRPYMTFHAQPKGDLGDRIIAAFAHAFNQEESSVIVAGGDCPALDEAVLRQAARALDTHDAVLGPTIDGGYYLLGLRSPHPELFTDIPWSTPEVLEETRRRLHEAQLSTHELPPLEDVDDAKGWRSAVAQGWLSA